MAAACPYGISSTSLGWLKSKGVAFSEQEVPGVGHVWLYWRQNLADMAPRLFQGNGK